MGERERERGLCWECSRDIDYIGLIEPTWSAGCHFEKGIMREREREREREMGREAEGGRERGREVSDGNFPAILTILYGLSTPGPQVVTAKQVERERERERERVRLS